MILTWYMPVLAFVLDFILGDPVFRAHPIRLMGLAIEKAEAPFRRLPCSETVNGLLFAVTLIVCAWGVTYLIVALTAAISPVLGGLVQIGLLYFCISAKDLQKCAKEIHALLSVRDLEQAKQCLSFIVGREVAPLDEAGVARATVETVAENLVDGVTSPLFFFALGGAPLALAYKMVNTLDSMVGYKNERFRQFGKAAAKIDDVANFIPARLSVPVIALAAHLLFKTGKESFSTAVNESRNHTSPNAGFSEAAFAGAFSVRLGGPNYYHGRLVEKPYIGEGLGEVEAGHIKKACELMMWSAVVWVVIVCLAVAVF